MVNQDQFIKREWYTCEENSHFYQFDRIEKNEFIASAWIHRGSFEKGYLKAKLSINIYYFNPNKKAPMKVVNKYILDKQIIIELW